MIKETRVKKAILFSVIAHGLLLAAALYTNISVAPIKEADTEVAAQQETEFVEVTETVSVECEASYIGIGIKRSVIDGLITDVAPNSPAQEAGIQKGDLLVQGLEKLDDANVTELMVVFQRDQTIISKYVTKRQICTTRGGL